MEGELSESKDDSFLRNYINSVDAISLHNISTPPHIVHEDHCWYRASNSSQCQEEAKSPIVIAETTLSGQCSNHSLSSEADHAHRGRLRAGNSDFLKLNCGNDALTASQLGREGSALQTGAPEKKKRLKRRWSKEEDDIILSCRQAIKSKGISWEDISILVQGRSPEACRRRWDGHLKFKPRTQTHNQQTRQTETEQKENSGSYPSRSRHGIESPRLASFQTSGRQSSDVSEVLPSFSDRAFGIGIGALYGPEWSSESRPVQRFTSVRTISQPLPGSRLQISDYQAASNANAAEIERNDTALFRNGKDGDSDKFSSNRYSNSKNFNQGISEGTQKPSPSRRRPLSIVNRDILTLGSNQAKLDPGGGEDVLVSEPSLEFGRPAQRSKLSLRPEQHSHTMFRRPPAYYTGSPSPQCFGNLRAFSNRMLTEEEDRAIESEIQDDPEIKSLKQELEKRQRWKRLSQEREARKKAMKEELMRQINDLPFTPEL